MLCAMCYVLCDMCYVLCAMLDHYNSFNNFSYSLLLSTLHKASKKRREHLDPDEEEGKGAQFIPFGVTKQLK